MNRHHPSPSRNLGLWYLRCRVCLTVVSVNWTDPRLSPEDALRNAECGTCRGAIEIMGRVARSRRLEQYAETVAACDERCVDATGPNCNCACGGENHGTGRVVELWRDAGGVPRVAVPTSDEAAARVAEFHALRAEFDAAAESSGLKALRERRRGGWLEPVAYSRLTSLELIASDYRHAMAMRTAKGRAKGARAAIAALAAAAAGGRVHA